MRLLTVLIFVSLVGCKEGEDSAKPKSETVAAMRRAMAGATEKGGLSGKVLESLAAEPYTYLRLATAAGEEWVAVPKTDAKVGADVIVENPLAMSDFESRTLNRKFDRVYFGTLAGEGGGMRAMGGGPPPGGAGSAPVEVGDVTVAKAEGPDGRTVRETFVGKSGLVDKKVVVRGKVVKYSGGILDRNWVHLRDGSGTAAAADNDLTVTTKDVAAVGDVVVAVGTLKLDKDFGAGYRYPVILEDATLTR